MSEQLEPEVAAYLDELAADIAAHGPSGDLMRDLQDAHQRRQAFALEMAAGQTDRAKMAREALCAAVYSKLVSQNAVRRCMAACEGIEWLRKQAG